MKTKMNLPNRLTVARMLLTPVCVAVIMIRGYEWSALLGALLFFLISLTDMLDGKIARKRGLVTDFGKFLDPLADKTLVLGAYLALIFREAGNDVWLLSLVLLTLITLFREFAVSSVRLITSSKQGIVVAANIYGKLKTVLQIVFVIAFLIEPTVMRLVASLFSSAVPCILYTVPPVATLSAVLCLICTVFSGAVYLKSYWPYISAEK